MNADKAESPKIFVDSNVVLNLLSGDEARANRSEALMAEHPMSSVQVLNEVASVCQHQLQMSWHELGLFLEAVKALCQVVPVTLEVHDLARQLAGQYGLAFRDACVVASATIEGCQTLYTHGMNGFIREHSLNLKDPFA